MNTIRSIKRVLQNEIGATMAEYAVIAAVVILVAILAFTSLGATIVAKIYNLAAGM